MRAGGGYIIFGIIFRPQDGSGFALERTLSPEVSWFTTLIANLISGRMRWSSGTLFVVDVGSATGSCPSCCKGFGSSSLFGQPFLLVQNKRDQFFPSDSIHPTIGEKRGVEGGIIRELCYVAESGG